jgi:hypothetical protein
MSVFNLFSKMEEVFTSNKTRECVAKAETFPEVIRDDPLQELMKDYNQILKAYYKYIEVLSQPEPIRDVCFKMMGIGTFEEGKDNITALTKTLSIMGKRIQGYGYKPTKQEAGNGFKIQKYPK